MAKSQTRASRKWNESNLDRLYITVPKGMKQEIEEHAKAQGISINALVNELLKKELEK